MWQITLISSAMIVPWKKPPRLVQKYAEEEDRRNAIIVNSSKAR